MLPFTMERPAALNAAQEAVARDGATPLAGGTTLVDLMKLGVETPDRLVDIKALAGPAAERMRRIEAGANELRLGALVRMSEAADDPAVRENYPALSESLWKAASAQLRNMATLGGNALQRTRCHYFRDTSWPCNKREPGSGCAALEGINRIHAVLGTSESCIASYPGDWAQAMIALDAAVEVEGPDGPRAFPFADLHVPPGDTPEIETTLRPGEIVTGFAVPARPWFRRSLYLKVRDRASYAFAIASAAVALDMADDGTVREARIGLGGVATVPWRAREAEAALAGRTLDEAAAEEAGRVAFAGATAHGHNDYKIELGSRTVARALLEAAAMEVRA